MISSRGYKLRSHPEQLKYLNSTARFNVVPAGRRSGKTEIAKRRTIIKAMQSGGVVAPSWPGRYFLAAPTRDQAKKIFWDDLKAFIPPLLQTHVSESELCIRLPNMAELYVLGMDKPARIEGSPWDGGILDEYGNMKEQTWTAHVRPALSDRQGWCDFIGVPEGRNHYYDLYQRALKDTTGEWEAFHWLSSDILPAKEIEAAKRDLDPLTFQQEYEGSFITFSGLVYYSFSEENNVWKLRYDPDDALTFCFDFNVSPGVAVVVQEIPVGEVYDVTDDLQERTITGCINEVHIPKHSNTVKVCDRLIRSYPDHKGEIHIYGDATGGSKGTAKLHGSDWEIVKQKLYGYYGDQRVFMKVDKSNPPERSRVNAVNSRILTLSGDVHLMIDPKCKYLIDDFQSVVMDEKTGGVDKSDLKHTHLTDSVGYYIAKRYPVRKLATKQIGVSGT